MLHFQFHLLVLIFCVSQAPTGTKFFFLLLMQHRIWLPPREHWMCCTQKWYILLVPRTDFIVLQIWWRISSMMWTHLFRTWRKYSQKYENIFLWICLSNQNWYFMIQFYFCYRLVPTSQIAFQHDVSHSCIAATTNCHTLGHMDRSGDVLRRKFSWNTSFLEWTGQRWIKCHQESKGSDRKARFAKRFGFHQMPLWLSSSRHRKVGKERCSTHWCNSHVQFSSYMSHWDSWSKWVLGEIRIRAR